MKKKMLFYSKLLIVVVGVLGLFFLLLSFFLKRKEAQNLEKIHTSVEEYLKEVEQYYVTSKVIGIEHYPTKVADLNRLISMKGLYPSRGVVSFNQDHKIVQGEFCVDGTYWEYKENQLHMDPKRSCKELP